MHGKHPSRTGWTAQNLASENKYKYSILYEAFFWFFFHFINEVCLIFASLVRNLTITNLLF